MPCERKHIEAIKSAFDGVVPCKCGCSNNDVLNVEAAINAALSACDESQWRSMESAPRDGTHILLCEGANVSEGGWLTGAMQGAEDESCAGWWSVGCIENPTHWMPLPEPPEVKP